MGAYQICLGVEWAVVAVFVAAVTYAVEGYKEDDLGGIMVFAIVWPVSVPVLCIALLGNKLGDWLRGS